MAYTRVGFEDPDYIEGESVSGDGSFNKSKRQAEIDAINASYNARQERQSADDQAARDAETALASENFGKNPSGRWDPTTQTYSDPNDPWKSIATRQQQERDLAPLRQAYADQQDMWADGQASVNMQRQMEARKLVLIENLKGSILKMSDGGPVSQQTANWANGVLAKAGVNGLGILPGGGIGQDGSFTINTFSGMDQNGNPIQSNGIKMGLQEAFTASQYLRGIYTDADRQKYRDAMLEAGFGEDYVKSLETDPFEKLFAANVQRTVDANTVEGQRKMMEAGAARMRGNPSGGRAVASVEADGRVARALFGRGGDNRSTISVYSNRDGGVTRTVNGHTGEDTGYQSLRTDEERADANAERLAKVANAKSSAADKLAIAAMREKGLSERAEADRQAKEKRAQMYADERKALREQNRILSEMRMLGTQRDKEFDTKKKEEIQKKIDELAKGLRDVPDPDAADQNGGTPATAGAATGAVVERKGQVKTPPPNVVTPPPAGTDPEAAIRAANGAAGRKRIAEGKQVGADGETKVREQAKPASNNQETNPTSGETEENNDSNPSTSYPEDFEKWYEKAKHNRMFHGDSKEKVFEYYKTMKKKNNDIKEIVRRNFGVQGVNGWDGRR